MSKRIEIVKKFLTAFSEENRNEFVEDTLSSDFTFSAPSDPLLNREEFFEKCWPYGHNLTEIKYVRIIENGDEIIITHEFTKPDGSRAQNTDVFIFSGDQISRFEVYFGWDIK